MVLDSPFHPSRLHVVKEPTVLQASDSSQDSVIAPERILKPTLASSTSSRSSDGELNIFLRFGGLPRSESSASMPVPREMKDEKELSR
ncbi:hypothetical protein CVT26_008115 [Gymnopilus dilepis]|uniref:Uncharacterized protein n=1 Tax=Gymnopilus dilepis TaxID=231916 RepID=A0A409YJT5_9AGAR|nr:hypothetical protein CVT26_008115 [Gymnopilus dilepis]